MASFKSARVRLGGLRWHVKERQKETNQVDPPEVNLVCVWFGVVGVCVCVHMCWCGVVWCGVAWHGVVWYGVAWCGVVWCGVVWLVCIHIYVYIYIYIYIYVSSGEPNIGGKSGAI